MGKVFLLLILVGLCWGAWGVYEHITRITSPPPKTGTAEPSAPPGKAKDPPAKPAESEIEIEELPVLASSLEWLLIEAWGFVRVGDPLPTGDTVQGWDASGVWIERRSGRVRVAFRRPARVLAAADKEARSTRQAERLSVFNTPKQ